MIAQGFYPLVLGLGVTSILIAYFDLLKGGNIPVWCWLPGAALVSLFLATGTGMTGFLLGGFLAVLALPSVWLTLKYVKRRKEDPTKIGAGDYFTLALFSFWPQMMVYVVIYSLTAGIIGKQVHLWDRGARGIPLAGLMGLFCMGYIVYTALM